MTHPNWFDQEADVNDAHYRQPAQSITTRLADAQVHSAQQKHMLAREIIHTVRTGLDVDMPFFSIVNAVVALLP